MDVKGEKKLSLFVEFSLSFYKILRIFANYKNKQSRGDGKCMQMLRVMFVVTDRVENITEHFVVTVVLVSSSEV